MIKNYDMKQNTEPLTADRKALIINLDKSIYGTFAEIGAGQEVARHFFHVGGAAGTIAKTISAYDMIFSDEIYGKVGRYVSRERLISMLDHEYTLLLKRLSEKQGDETTFFVFSDTVAARNYKGTNECHGWMGIRFQTEPRGEPSQIIVHIRMTDSSNLLQQQALGIFGVNLVYGAYFCRDNPDLLISSLLDELSLERIEVDMIEFSGPVFQEIDNRIMSLRLVQKGLTNAVMFGPGKQVLQPSEAIYKHPVILLRGHFRPVTNLNLDMLRCALEQSKSQPSEHGQEPLVLFELTLKNLLFDGTLDESDFLMRADIISALGHRVLISNYSEYYRVTSYFRRYTKERIGMVLGLGTLLHVLDQKYYETLEGGTLEALSLLLKGQVKLYVYPILRKEYLTIANSIKVALIPKDETELPAVITARDVRLVPELRHLYQHLLEIGFIQPLAGSDERLLSTSPGEVLSKLLSGTESWEDYVPPAAAALIKERLAFGYRAH